MYIIEIHTLMRQWLLPRKRGRYSKISKIIDTFWLRRQRLFRDTQRHTSSTSRVGRRASYAAVDTRYVCAASFLICLCSYEQVCHFSISITFNPFRSLEYDVRTAAYCSLWNCPEFHTSTRAIKSVSPLCYIYWRNYQCYSHDRDTRSWKITGETWLCKMTLIQFNEHGINSAPQEFQV